MIPRNAKLGEYCNKHGMGVGCPLNRTMYDPPDLGDIANCVEAAVEGTCKEQGSVDILDDPVAKWCMLTLIVAYTFRHEPKAKERYEQYRRWLQGKMKRDIRLTKYIAGAFLVLCMLLVWGLASRIG